MADTAYTILNTSDMREDLLDVLTNLSPTETQLITGLGTSTASATQHEWLMDTLSSVKDNNYVEGADASFNNITNPSRLINYTQIMRQGFKVSDTERAVNTAGFSDRYDYEGIKALKMLKNDMEYAVLRGTIQSIVGGTTAGKMQGIKSWLSIVTSQSGVSLSETILNDYLQNVWNLGTEVNAVYVPMTLKRRISGFTAGATKNVNLTDRRLVNAVDVYEADAARMVKLFAHRYVTVSGDTHNDIVGINEDLFRVAYLRKPFKREIPRTGDAAKGEVLTEATLECLHQYGGFLGQKHL